MCSFERVGSPKGSEPRTKLGTSFETGRGYPLEISAFGGTGVSEGTSPLSMGAGLTHKEKDDLGERRVLWRTVSPTECGLRVGLGKEDFRWRERPLESGKYEERTASSETKCPLNLNKGLEFRLKRQDLSRTPMERSNLGVTRVSASQETRPPLGMLPENECLLVKGSGRRTRDPLGMVCGSPQALGSRRGPVAGAPEGFGASVDKQQALGVAPSQELGKEPSCVVVKPSAEMTCPVEVDIGLPQPEEPDAVGNTEPSTGLVIEPSECQFAQQPEEEMEAENFEPGVEPSDRIRPIYTGKFFDRMPCYPSAGKVIPIGDRVAACLTEKLPRPITPPEAKKFYNFRYPPAGAERVFYGRANDPQIAQYLTHGIRSKLSEPADVLINPQPITTYQQKIKDKKESIYFSNQRAPLGKSHDQSPGLPKGLDVHNTTFGTKVIRDISAGDVVNPPKPFHEVFKEGEEGHDLYVVSHNDYYVGEAKNRKYNPSTFHRFNLFGLSTPHFNDGRTIAQSLYWLHELQMKKGAKVVSKRIDDFKEKFQHQLGRVLDPIAETMNVHPDHTFGACLRPDDYGSDDLIYNRLPSEYLRGKDRERALVAAVRHHLKNFNCEKFDSLVAAFRHYDKKGDGVIDKEELLEACEQANLHLDEKLLDQLFAYCDVDNDGLISFLEFANFLNWKDKMPLKEYEERVVIKGGKPDCENPAEAISRESEPTLLIKPEDIVLNDNSEKTLRTLLRPKDKVASHYKTTSSAINAVVGAVPSMYCRDIM
ncbi:EF-hand domain-containing family member B isoform X3 [Pipistrellus kuhlii]|uniref:EF-hand domain-containing family member B isoform X3 n=1 Tax=Pipistrellus kuhlii TaxID=59472 RepID=UPI00174ED855|nr:EF-hand domain-containing family member B isoform X3 [Pipistrellus kuhlii]